MKKPKSVKQILNSKSAGLQGLLQHTQQLNALNKRLMHLLPAPLPQHCTTAGIEQQQLILMTDSPVWATRLRLQAPNLIKALPEFQIKSVVVKIQPSRKAPEAAPRACPKMSSDASSLLNYLADATSDLKLKLALQRLARNGSK